MAHLSIQQLQVSYGDKTVLHNIDLNIQQGEMVALLGPSGCGKTTLLNALCGFVPVGSGSICMAGKDITNQPPEQRNITMVFQSYALWPHMTVAQNIAYGLKVRRVPKAEIVERIKEMLEIVKLSGVENEKVTQLSGGQRQRVALARALVVKPDILVLDEPLSNLDAKVRLSVRHEIKALQQRLGFTSVIVTHDQEEALVMADRVAVLNDGHIEQIGTPEEIYQSPKTPFVADFMGADNRFVYAPKITGKAFRLYLPKTSLELHHLIYFRSSAASICKDLDNRNLDGLTLTGTVEQSAFLGQNYRHNVRHGEQLIQADSPDCWPLDSEVSVHVPPHALYVYPHMARSA